MATSQFTQLQSIKPRDTYFLNMTAIGSTRTFDFFVKTYTRDTQIYKVSSLSHYSNFTGEVVFNVYNGPNFVIFNPTSNCARSTIEPEQTSGLEFFCMRREFECPPCVFTLNWSISFRVAGFSAVKAHRYGILFGSRIDFQPINSKRLNFLDKYFEETSSTALMKSNRELLRQLEEFKRHPLISLSPVGGSPYQILICCIAALLMTVLITCTFLYARYISLIKIECLAKFLSFPPLLYPPLYYNGCPLARPLSK